MLGLSECIDMGLAGRYSEFNGATHTVKTRCQQLFDWVAEGWPAVNELEMTDIPWRNVGERIQRLKETGILEGIFYVKPTPLYGRDHKIILIL